MQTQWTCSSTAGCSGGTRYVEIYPDCEPYNELADHQAKVGATNSQPENALDVVTRKPLIRRSCHSTPIHYEWMKKVNIFLPDEQTESPFPRRNAPTRLTSAVVISLLFDAGSIWWVSQRIPSADCVFRRLNLLNIYGYDVRRFWWDDTIATLAMQWTNSYAFHVQL